MGPLGVFAQILQSSASGLQLVAGSAKLLATSLAPILLPAAVVLSTALLAVGDAIWEEVLPNLEEFFEFVLSTAIPAIEVLVESFIDAAGIVTDFVNWVERQIDSLDPTTSSYSEEEIAKQIARLRAMDSTPDGRRVTDQEDTGSSGGDFGEGSDKQRQPQSPPGSVGSKVEERAAKLTSLGLSDTIKELRQSIGPQASFSSLTQVGQNAQLAALNQSPFEARLLLKMDQLIRAMEKFAANTTRRPGGAYDERATGAGNYEGTGSSGGDFGGSSGGDF